MPIDLNNTNVAILGQLAVASYIGEGHELALKSVVRSLAATCSESIAAHESSIDSLAQLAGERYAYHTAIGEGHERALESVAVIIAMACNLGRTIKMLRPPDESRHKSRLDDERESTWQET